MLNTLCVTEWLKLGINHYTLNNKNQDENICLNRLMSYNVSHSVFGIICLLKAL